MSPSADIKLVGVHSEPESVDVYVIQFISGELRMVILHQPDGLLACYNRQCELGGLD